MAAVSLGQIFPTAEVGVSSGGEPALILPVSELPNLDESEMVLDGGKFPQLLYGILKVCVERYNLLPTAQRSARLVMVRNNPTGAAPTLINSTFQAIFQLDVTSADVASE